MIRASWLWLLWLLCPIFALSVHYGPGQLWLARDLVAEKIAEAESISGEAQNLQERAYELQLEVIAARRDAFLAGVDWQSQPQHPLSVVVNEKSIQQDKAYGAAAERWSLVTETYGDAIETFLETLQSPGLSSKTVTKRDQHLMEYLRWAEARAMVRSGLVFNGIDQFQALLDMRVTEAETGLSTTSRGTGAMSVDSTVETTRLPLGVIREELAAAQYVGARLLREEGRSPEVWKPVANSARQQYRYLAEHSGVGKDQSTQTVSSVSSAGQGKSGVDTNVRENTSSVNRDERIKRNLEQVLNLEQSSAEQLEGVPLPRQAPMARRPGDGEPGDRPGKGPGRGPMQDGPPGDGAGIPRPFGSGW